MMPAVFTIALSIFFLNEVTAQTSDKTLDAVADIRRLYNEVSEKLKADLSPTPIFYRTDVIIGANEKTWSAVGTYQRLMQVYFEITDEGRAERLIKAHEKLSFGKRKYATEYLFNPKGELVFYKIMPLEIAVTDSVVGEPFEYVNQPQVEAQCYYARGKLIQFVKGEGKNAETKQQNFLVREKELAEDGQARAKLLKAMFAASVKLN